MKYNRALDLMAASAGLMRANKIESAAKALAAAVKDPSFVAAMKIIEASNKKAYTAAVKAGVIKADTGIDAENPGEEFRMDVEENSGDRVVQEAKAKALRSQARKLIQRADAMMEDDSDDMGGDGDMDEDDTAFLDNEATADFDAGDMDEEAIEDEDVGEEMTGPEQASFIRAFGSRAKATPVKSAVSKTAAFARAVRNMNALK